MCDAPERIWAWGDNRYVEADPQNQFATEYIRADFLTAQPGRIAALEDSQDLTVAYLAGFHKRGDEVRKLEAERDQALAQAAAAAMEMRERSADASGHYMSDEVDELLLDIWREDIRALPIDPDAQKALDRTLAEARLEGWRAGRDEALAQVAAAYEAAAGVIVRLKGMGWDGAPAVHPYDRGYVTACNQAVSALSALTPAVAKAALDRMLDEAYQSGQRDMREYIIKWLQNAGIAGDGVGDPLTELLLDLPITPRKKEGVE